MPISKEEKKKMCSGCHDDYYNHGNNSTSGECWLLSKSKVVTRFRIGWWVQPDSVSRFTEMKVLDCYSQPGQFAFMKELPKHLQK